MDNNGVISKSELGKLVNDMSGIMTKTRMEESLSEEEITNTCWNEMDTDRDGSITSEEFVTSVLRHDKFSKLLAMQFIELFT